MSPEDVAYLVELHAGFVGVPAGLHAALCRKLVGGVLDAGASFYIAEDGDSAALETRALVDLTAEGDVWLCEYAATFSSRNDLLSLVQQEGGDESGVARPLHTLAALPPGAGAASVVDVLARTLSVMDSARPSGTPPSEVRPAAAAPPSSRRCTADISTYSGRPPRSVRTSCAQSDVTMAATSPMPRAATPTCTVLPPRATEHSSTSTNSRQQQEQA
jgi:hypothetical protein